MTPFQRIVAIRTGGYTERCHGVPHHGSYSVAMHSWGVAMLMYVLWPKDFQRLVVYCLVHDIPEAWVGDIPATTKKFCPGVKANCDELEDAILRRLLLPNDVRLSDEDKVKLRACDHLELYWWAKEQIEFGNKHACSLIRQLDSFFTANRLPDPAWDLWYGYLRFPGTDTQLATDGLIQELTEQGHGSNQRA